GDVKIDAPVAVEVGEDGVAGRRGGGDAIRRGRFGEGAVDVVAVDRAPARPDEEKIEIADMVEIDEGAALGTGHVGDARPRGDVGEGAVAGIAEQVAAPITADGEQVEPAVVVDVG